MLSLEEYWGKKTLILGDVNSGKTQMALELLTLTIDTKRDEVAVLDLAPEKTAGIGGKMPVPSHSLVFYYTTTIIPPRLTGRDRTEVEAFSLDNAKAIEKLFSTYLKNPKNILAINDVSLYLQKGDLSRLLKVLSPSHTVIINGYYGKSLGESSFSEREREQMNRLARACDRVIYL
jgi:hypothetical protein